MITTNYGNDARIDTLEMTDGKITRLSITFHHQTLDSVRPDPEGRVKPLLRESMTRVTYTPEAGVSVRQAYDN